MRRQRWLPVVLLPVLMAGAVWLQHLREQVAPPAGGVALLYVRSPEAMKRLALSFDSLAADIYWIRALQHYGRNRLSGAGEYPQLFPLLDITTSLDPHFNIAYRFGAIFLTEPPPWGPGRPDQAIALLEKGLASRPDRWEYAHDIGFVYYRQRDYRSAADWFQTAADIPGAAGWLQPLQAVTRTRGGDRQTARRLWSELLNGAGAEDAWLRNEAARRLRQIDALDAIDTLQRINQQYEQRTGRPPASWADLLRAGYLRGVPRDPDGYVFQLNPYRGRVTVDPKSPLSPLPREDGEVP